MTSVSETRMRSNLLKKNRFCVNTFHIRNYDAPINTVRKMVGHIYVRISKSAILLLLLVIITQVPSQLIDYAAVYGIRPHQGFLLLNLATYTDVSEIQQLTINNYKCIRAKDASDVDFADLGLVTCDLADQTQVVQLYRGDYGFFLGTNANSTKGLTVDSGSLEETALVNRYELQDTTTKSQQWSFIPYFYSSYEFLLESTLSTGKCLTAHDEYMTLTTCGNMNGISNPSENQLWVMIFSQARIRGHLQNMQSNECLYGESDNAEIDFAEVGFKVCDSSDAAQVLGFEWSINSANPQAIEFSTGKVLSIVAPSVASNAPVQQMTKFYYGNQLWIPGAKKGDWFRIRNIDTQAFCLGVAVNSSQLEMQLCGDTTTENGFAAVAQQVWRFLPNP